MNHGQWTFALLLVSIAVAITSGTIHSARASFTVVPTASAVGPYFAPAPTTELVSWIASAAHNPNCVCEKCMRWPMSGNSRSATEFSTNTVPSDTAISSSLAASTGPIAAIALPPHTAVPKLISSDCFLPTCSILPSRTPSPSANAMLIAVYIKPEAPAWTTSLRFIPNPRHTTAACNKNLERFRLSTWNSCTVLNPNANPAASASGGPINPLAATIIPI